MAASARSPGPRPHAAARGVVGLQLETVAPVRQGLRRPPLRVERVAQAHVGLRVFRVERERAAPFPDGSPGISPSAQDQPQIVVRGRIPGVRRQRLAQLNERLVQPAQPGQRTAQVGARGGEIRFQFGGFLELRHGFLHPPGLDQQHAEIVESRRGRGIGFRRRAQL